MGGGGFRPPPGSFRVKVPNYEHPRSKSLSPADTDEVTTSKPNGRVAMDRGRGDRKLNLLKCKQLFTVSTLNTRTSRSIHLQEELCCLAKEFKQDIIGVQEHRIAHTDEEVRYQDMCEGYQLVSASEWRNSAGIPVGVVGIIMNLKAKKKSLLSCSSISPRIISATFGGNPKTTIINTYSPTNSSEEDEADQHYKLRNKTQHTMS